MQRLAELEAELASFERQTLRTITADQKNLILQLASDFPRLWTAATTSARDRKRMLRVLVKDITVARGREPKQLRLQVRWQGGETETVELQLPPSRAEAVRYPSEFVVRIGDLAKDHDDEEIAASLDREGLQSSTGKSFTASMISWVRFKHRIPGPSRPSGTLSVAEVRQRYGVTHWVVYDWIGKGLVSHTGESPDCPTPSPSPRRWTAHCASGLPTPLALHHLHLPELELSKVQYEARIGMPSSHGISAITLWDLDPFDGLRTVRVLPQRRRQLRQIDIRLCREPFHALPIHIGCTFVGLDFRPGHRQRRRCEHLVHQTEPFAAFDAVRQRRQHALRPHPGFDATIRPAGSPRVGLSRLA